MANEHAYPRDIVKGTGQGKGCVPATKSRFNLGQPEHCTPPHFDDSVRVCILEITFRVIEYCSNSYFIFQRNKHIIFVIMLLCFTFNGCLLHV